VNKMLFPVGTIPVFSTISYFFSHLLMIAISIIIFAAAKYPLTVYLLQLPFYLLLFFIFCCILAMFISTLGVISRDFEQFIKAILNVFFWMSPVLWQLSNVKNKYIAFVLKLNPFNYFITGYRDAYLGQAWFWEHQKYTIYIVAFIVLFALFTASLHKKLSPEFADVL
ncbi:MAG: ABC transporter permease, partial [Oscillospiraceae bacterium]|nr:ABC transporter permease [Oscillospiraceae bacterium]